MNQILYQTHTVTCSIPLRILNKTLWAVLFSLACNLLQAQPTGTELLERSIAYHDPNGQWPALKAVVRYQEYRQDNEIRKTTVFFDNSTNHFKVQREIDDVVITRGTHGDSCYVLLNGSPDFSDEQRKQHRLDCERSVSYRNYYLFMQGLPMKLKDPGTVVHRKVSRENFKGKDSYALKVTYEEEVGSDTWYIYINPQSYAVVGYRFYHDETQGDGEYLDLSGEIKVGEMIWPKERAWYTNKSDEYLGRDIIAEIN